MSSTCARLFAVVAALGCAGVAALAEDPKTIEAIHKQADDVAKKDWKALSKQGEALAKSHEREDVMKGFKKPKNLEAKIMNLSRNPLLSQALEREQAELVRLGEITAAIASVAVHQCDVQVKTGDKDPAQWKKWMEELHQASRDLIKAAREKKPQALLDAAKNARMICAECHSVFR